MRALFLLLILSISTLSISSLAQETNGILTLDKALEIALENNPTLEASRASVEIMKAMGIIGDFNYELEDVLEYKMIDLNLEQAIDKAFELRPELDSLEAKKVAMKANLKASKQDYYPSIFGRTAYRIKGEGATQPAFIAGIGVQFPIFEGFSSLSEVNEAKANLRRFQAEIKVTETSKTSSEENLELARERYRLGRASSIELAEAEALYASTNADYIQVIYNYKIAVAQLQRAIGEKLEE